RPKSIPDVVAGFTTVIAGSVIVTSQVTGGSSVSVRTSVVLPAPKPPVTSTFTVPRLGPGPASNGAGISTCCRGTPGFAAAGGGAGVSVGTRVIVPTPSGWQARRTWRRGRPGSARHRPG